MLRIARILQPSDSRRAWLAHCDRCGACTPTISHRAAVELDRTPCLGCEVSGPELEAALEEARRFVSRN